MKLFNYQYNKRGSIMTPKEILFYNLILSYIKKDESYLFPQIHLDEIFDGNIKGQNFWGALSCIQRKSVDFLICNKDMKPLIAIELDDTTHFRKDRIRRDKEVESLFCRAGIHLYRIGEEIKSFDEELYKDIQRCYRDQSCWCGKCI